MIKNINFHQHPSYKWLIFLFHLSVLLSEEKSSESKLFHLILISSLLHSAEKDAAISRGDLLFLIMFSNDLLALAMLLHRNICLTLILFSNLTSSSEPKCSCCYQQREEVRVTEGDAWKPLINSKAICKMSPMLIIIYSVFNSITSIRFSSCLLCLQWPRNLYLLFI